jgi:dihydrofolate reductase
MRRLVLKMSMTLDGYVGGPAGEIDWIMRTLDDDSTSWIEETLWQAGAHLVGRRTYTDMVSYWPTSTELLAAPMNAIPKIMFSRSGSLAHEPTTALRNATDAQSEMGLPLSEPPANWDDTRKLSGDLAAEIADLKAESGKDLLAHGGASFAQSLVRLGLVDEYRLSLSIRPCSDPGWLSSRGQHRSISSSSTRRLSPMQFTLSSATRADRPRAAACAKRRDLMAGGVFPDPQD